MHLITENDYPETITMDTDKLIDELAICSGVHHDAFEFVRSTYHADDMINGFDNIIWWACGYSDALDWLSDCKLANIEWSND